MRFIQKQSTSH